MAIIVEIEKQAGDFFLQTSFEAGNETLALLGASGCGKSMTLKCIAGMEKPDRGRIILDGVTLFDSEKRICLPPQKRKTGLLFQNYALFPNMTVEQNIRAGAAAVRDRSAKKAAVQEMMERFQIMELAKLYPSQLSGGQQQRTALARLLISQPDLLMLDEPFSALDTHLRLQMEQEVRSVIQSFGKTVLLVSHEKDEVFRMSDRIALMNSGKLEKIGTKQDVFQNPETREGARLTGCRNISAAEAVGEHLIRARDWGIVLHTQKHARDVRYVGIREHEIWPAAGGASENQISASVTDVMENPFSYTILLRPENGDGTSLLLWEAEKAYWKKHEAKQVTVELAAESILMLKE